MEWRPAERRRSEIKSRPGPSIIKPFSYSTQLSMEFQLLMKTKMLKNKDFSSFQAVLWYINHSDKCLNANNCWHFDIYEYDKFRAQLS